MWAAEEAAHATGAARRRRERRLRAYLRYARKSVEMALAECQHHSAQRQKKARAREEERVMHYTAAFRTTVPPPEPELFDLFEEPGGVRPNLLLEPQGPQDRDQLRTVEQTVGFGPLVQILDAPVAQMVEQLPNLAQFFDTLRSDPVQVIEVPKILPHDVPRRRLRRRTQLAEQLVEVPTIISYSSLQRTVEQSVDIPVPGRGGRIACLQGFLPRQSPTALHGSQERISEQIVEQNVDFAVGGGLQDFLPGQSSSASSSSPAGFHGSADGPGSGFFRTFQHELKKSEVRREPESEGARQWQLMDSGGL